MIKFIHQLLVLIVISLLTQHCFSQERINAPLPKINSEIIGQLDLATGWLYNPEGQWISEQNRIPRYLKNEFKQLLDFENYGLGIDNFISYQLRQVSISDSSFYLLTKKHHTGYYKYPILETEWIPTISIDYWVIPKQAMDTLKNIIPDSASIFPIKILCSGSIDYNASTYMNDLEKDILISSKNANVGLYSKHELVIIEKTFSNSAIARFLIFERIKLGYSSDYIGIENSEHRIFVWYPVLNNCYYETPLNLFKGLFRLN